MATDKNLKAKLEEHKAVVSQINEAVTYENLLEIASLADDFDKSAEALSKAMAVNRPKTEAKTSPVTK